MSDTKRLKSVLPIMLFAGLLLSACDRGAEQHEGAETMPQAADMVLINGGIYTVDDERSWAEAVDIADIQAMEDAGSWCLDTYNVKFVRSYFSTDRKRMLCLYAAPDAESVRQAQRQINMPMDSVWAFELINPR